MLSAQSKELEGATYHVLPLPTGASIMVAAKVLRMAAPAFSDVASLVAAGKAVRGVLEGLATGLFADLDPEVLLFVAREFSKVTSFEAGGVKLPLVSDKADLFDEHFRGRFLVMLQWLAFAASVSFPFVAKAIQNVPSAPPAEG